MTTVILLGALAVIVTGKVIIRWINVHDDVHESSQWDK